MYLQHLIYSFCREVAFFFLLNCSFDDANRKWYYSNILKQHHSKKGTWKWAAFSALRMFEVQFFMTNTKLPTN